MNKDTLAAWLKDYMGLVDQARDQIIKLLTCEWLVSDVEDTSGDRRRRDLIRIRQILFQSRLSSFLHSLLVSLCHFSPSKASSANYLQLALDLANTVADSRYKIYEDFVNQDGRSLGDHLGAVRQKGLEGGI